MQLLRTLNNISKAATILVCIAIFYTFPQFLANKVKAQDFTGCPQGVQEVTDTTNPDASDNGTYIQGYDANGNPIFMKCQDPKTTIERIITSIIMYMILIIGLVLAFSIAKSSILMMTAIDNQEQFQTAVKSLVTSITAVVGVFFAYLIIVFIMTGILGIGTSKTHEWDLICGNRILFSITLGNGSPQCTTI